jgi:multidrug efflux pump subunit AcrA (membrane-fusion protein)
MPSEDIRVPSRRSLLTTAAAGVLLAGIVVGYGFVNRAQSKQEIVDWTNTQATPTVALAKPVPGGPQQTLTLPGNIQPFNKAAIYARVNGYVKGWDHDIGSAVKAGQVLATVDAPDLDQQLARPRRRWRASGPIIKLPRSPPAATTSCCKSRSWPSSLRTRPPPTRRRRRP